MNIIILDKKDNVATALEDIHIGDTIFFKKGLYSE